MFKRDIWCLWWCSAFKPSSLNKINCGDAGLAICSVTMGGRREGVERSKSQVPCTPLPRLVHMKYLAVVTGSHCDFIGGLVRRSEPVLLQYSDCHLSSTSRWDCFSCLPSHHWYISLYSWPAGCLKSQYFCSAQIYWISNIVIWQRYGEYPTLPGHWDHCPVGEMWKYFGKKKLEFFSWCLRQHFHANYRNEKCDVRSPTGRLNWVASCGWDIKSHQSSWLLTSNWLAFYQLFCQIFVGDQSDRH